MHLHSLERLRGALSWSIVFLALGLINADAGWRAGVSSIVITPKEPTWLAGYPEDRKRPFEKVTLDVNAKALVLEDEAGRRMAIITLDLHGITAPLRKEIGRLLNERHGLLPDQILINASHTHCGPEVRDPQIARPGLKGERILRAAAFRRELVAKVVRIVSEAFGGMESATLEYGQGHAGFAMNRRPDFTLPPGHPAHNVRPNPWGPVDHSVPILKVSGLDGRIRAVLFGYACHNTTLNGYQINGDYAGYAQRYLEDDLPGTTAMFIAGCGGDQNPTPRRTIALAEQHGRTLANAVHAALDAARLPLTPRLACRLAYVSLSYKTPPSRTELTARLSSRAYFEADHARLLLDRLDRDGALPATYPCPVQVVAVGPGLLLVALGGEVVVDYSLRLKRELAGPHVWVAGYSNDVFTYIPSERILAEGGYEGDRCMRYTETMGLHPGPWEPGLEDAIVAKVHALARDVRAELQ